MAVRMLASPIDFPDTAVEPIADRSRSISGLGPDGAPEINLGAFRGLAFALVFETVLVIFGALAWQIFRALH